MSWPATWRSSHPTRRPSKQESSYGKMSSTWDSWPTLPFCNFSKGKREIERARLENRHPALHRGCRVSSGHHVPRPHHPLAPVRNMDHPPPPRPVEHAIAEVHGSSVALNAMRANMESSKAETDLSLKEMVICKKQEANGYREELIFCKKTIMSGEDLFDEMQRVDELLQRSVHSFHLTMRGVERAGSEALID
ncbi:hypothetical protein PG985_006716 [Apiospora marii]|uniref:uncharacterized protein n=1 Tax=Apiospora marii TaxID=335849 RepID=UPI00312EB0EA